jgi:hypothetical protein
VIDVHAAYRSTTPSSPSGCQGRALVQRGDEVTEMYIFGRWPEGRRERFNLVKFEHGKATITCLGWNGDLVEVLSC